MTVKVGVAIVAGVIAGMWLWEQWHRSKPLWRESR